MGTVRAGRRLGAALVLAGLVGAVGLTGACSGSDDDGDDGGGDGALDGALADLVGRLPEDARELAIVDVAAVRRDLGLPDDQGADQFDDDADRTLTMAVATAVPFLANPRETPIRQEIDTGAMTAAASVPLALARDRAVMVIRTSQPFEDLATALEAHGYERDGDLVVTDAPVAEVGMTVLAPAGDDLVVLAQSPEVARAVAAGEGDGPALAGVLGTVEGPLRMALETAEDSDSCFESVAAGWQVDPAGGEIAVTVTDEDDADGDALFPDGTELVRGLDLDEPEVDGGTVRVRFRQDGPGMPFGFLTGEIPAGSFYRCP